MRHFKKLQRVTETPKESLADRAVDLMGYALWINALVLSMHMEVCDG